MRTKNIWIDRYTGIKFAYVHSGKFEMGDVFNNFDSWGFVHPVELDSFWLSMYQITQYEWEKVMGSNPSRFLGLPNRPVEQVSWNDVHEFLAKLNQISCQGFRLPTEAEWEYAARSGGKYEKFAGGYEKNLVAWHWENSSWKGKLPPNVGTIDDGGPYEGHSTHPVGEKLPNGLGLYDMSGNVWEWGEDFFAPFTSEYQYNPKGPACGTLHVNRGGGWCDREPTGGVTTTIRYGLPSDFRRYNLGFRIARTNIPM